MLGVRLFQTLRDKETSFVCDKKEKKIVTGSKHVSTHVETGRYADYCEI